MTSTPPVSRTPARRRARAAILATAAALGLATIPGLASAAPATAPTITSATFPTGSSVASPTPLATINGGDVTYAPGSHGSVQEIFARDAAGTVFENWESSNGGWSGWVNRGSTP